MALATACSKIEYMNSASAPIDLTSSFTSRVSATMSASRSAGVPPGRPIGTCRMVIRLPAPGSFVQRHGHVGDQRPLGVQPVFREVTVQRDVEHGEQHVVDLGIAALGHGAHPRQRQRAMRQDAVR